MLVPRACIKTHLANSGVILHPKRRLTYPASPKVERFVLLFPLLPCRIEVTMATPKPNPQKTKCPKCGQSIGYKPQNEGRQVKCPHCDAPVRLVQAKTTQQAAIEKVSAQLEDVEDPSTVATVFRAIKNRIFGKRGDKNRPRKPWMIVMLQIFGFFTLNYGLYGLFTSEIGGLEMLSSLKSLTNGGLENLLSQSTGGKSNAEIVSQLKALQSTLVYGFYACLGAICYLGGMVAEYTFKIWHHLKTER